MTLRDKAAQANGGAIEPRPDDAVSNAEPQSIAGWLDRLRPELERALPATMSADRMARLALTEIRKNPDLAQCTPASFAGSLLTAAALGLEVGTVGEAYLVPYEHRRGPLSGTVECQFQVGYQGYSKLFFQHPLAADLDAQAVYEADEFDYAYGTDKFLRHRPAKVADRGAVVYYYAIAYLRTGSTHFVVLTPEEVKALRGGKVGPSGRIADPQRWMERKTALRQCLKVLPKSTTLAAAMVAEETPGEELYREQITQRQIDATETPAEREPGPVTTDAPSPQGTPVEVPPREAEEPPAEGEIVDPVVPDPADGDDPWVTQPPSTPAQRTRIHASLSDLNVTDRDKKLEFCGDVIGHEISSSTDLTLSEASQVIEVLNAGLREAGIEPPGDRP